MELFKLARQDHVNALKQLQGMGFVETIYLTGEVAEIKKGNLKDVETIGYCDTITPDEFSELIEQHVNMKRDIVLYCYYEDKGKEIALKYIMNLLKKLTAFEDAINETIETNEDRILNFLEDSLCGLRANLFEVMRKDK